MTVSRRFRKWEIVQQFLNAFYTKATPPQSLLPDMELLKKMFPPILDMKNGNKVQEQFFENNAEDGMTHFIIFLYFNLFMVRLWSDL